MTNRDRKGVAEIERVTGAAFGTSRRIRSSAARS